MRCAVSAARDEGALCEVEQGVVEREKGRPSASETEQSARWSRRYKMLCFPTIPKLGCLTKVASYPNLPFNTSFN
jgi:hypothetical protein